VRLRLWLVLRRRLLRARPCGKMDALAEVNGNGSAWCQAHANASGWNPSKLRCAEQARWSVPGTDVVLYHPLMVLCAGLGVAVGLAGHTGIVRRGLGSADVRCAYALTFATFACMNLSGMAVFTLWPQDDMPQDRRSWRQKTAFMLDGAFSSITSLNFSLCALSDLGVLRLRSRRGDGVVVAAAFALIFYAYFLQNFRSGWDCVWQLLYTDLTRISSTLYFSVTLLRMAWRRSARGALPLVAAIVIGLKGLHDLVDPALNLAHCHLLGGLLTQIEIWYLESDASLALLLAFYYASHATPEGQLADSEPLKHALLAAP
jgi:hypothetical protein